MTVLVLEEGESGWWWWFEVKQVSDGLSTHLNPPGPQTLPPF